MAKAIEDHQSMAPVDESKWAEGSTLVSFEVAGAPCEVHVDPALRAWLRIGPDARVLQPWRELSSWGLDFKLLRSWEHQFEGHTIRIEKERARLWAAFRPMHYRVFVDGQLVEDRAVVQMSLRRR
jgi:hypothetical protein